MSEDIEQRLADALSGLKDSVSIPDAGAQDICAAVVSRNRKRGLVMGFAGLFLVVAGTAGVLQNYLEEPPNQSEQISDVVPGTDVVDSSTDEGRGSELADGVPVPDEESGTEAMTEEADSSAAASGAAPNNEPAVDEAGGFENPCDEGFVPSEGECVPFAFTISADPTATPVETPTPTSSGTTTQPTSVPTTAPTAVPTTAPTSSPAPPTAVPTSPPTVAPTTAPTPTPTPLPAGSTGSTVVGGPPTTATPTATTGNATTSVLPPSTPTATAVPPTSTSTSVPSTSVPPTPTSTSTTPPVPPTPSPTATPAPPTATSTATSVPATPTPTATRVTSVTSPPPPQASPTPTPTSDVADEDPAVVFQIAWANGGAPFLSVSGIGIGGSGTGTVKVSTPAAGTYAISGFISGAASQPSLTFRSTSSVVVASPPPTTFLTVAAPTVVSVTVVSAGLPIQATINASGVVSDSHILGIGIAAGDPSNGWSSSTTTGADGTGVIQVMPGSASLTVSTASGAVTVPWNGTTAQTINLP